MTLHARLCWDCQMGDHDQCDGRDMMGYHCDCGCYMRRTLSAFRSHDYYIPELLEFMEEPYRKQIRDLSEGVLKRFPNAPGSRKAHQAWPGGYWHHVVETCNIAIRMYNTFTEVRKLPFSLSDVLIVLFLHDIEKPFKHSGKFAGHDKAWWLNFKFGVIEAGKITLTPELENAIRYCEGEGDDYVPGERVMNELAAFCHCADVLSARLWHNKGENGAW